jgi:antitoxin component YwqK of YwqJK toxin-antitoxin module
MRYFARRRAEVHPIKMDANKHDDSAALKNGMVKEFFKDGVLSCTGEYGNGEKIGVWKYYLRNGSLKAIGKYADGKLTGEWKWYRENGKLMQTGSFNGRKENGHLEEIPPQRSTV